MVKRGNFSFSDSKHGIVGKVTSMAMVAVTGNSKGDSQSKSGSKSDGVNDG